MKNGGIFLQRITHFTVNNLADVNVLLRQWSGASHPLTTAYFKTLIKKSYVLGLYDGTVVIGTATLIPLYKLSGLKGSVEHVIVGEKYRGQGLGEKLMREIIVLAKKLKMRHLFLTCEPDRAAALALYKKLGFKEKNTAFFQLSL